MSSFLVQLVRSTSRQTYVPRLFFKTNHVPRLHRKFRHSIPVALSQACLISAIYCEYYHGTGKHYMCLASLVISYLMQTSESRVNHLRGLSSLMILISFHIYTYVEILVRKYTSPAPPVLSTCLFSERTGYLIYVHCVPSARDHNLNAHHRLFNTVHQQAFYDTQKYEQKDYMSAVFPPLFLNIKKASRRLMTFCAAPIARHRCVNTRLDAMMPSMKMENGHVQHAMCIVHTAITKGKLPYSHSNQSSTT
jgi:hypothetical protein